VTYLSVLADLPASVVVFVILPAGIGFGVLMWKCFDWAEKHEAEKRRKKIEEEHRREFEELKEKHPEWAEELDPAKVQEQKDRAEFERIAREHPEWLQDS